MEAAGGGYGASPHLRSDAAVHERGNSQRATWKREVSWAALGFQATDGGELCTSDTVGPFRRQQCKSAELIRPVKWASGGNFSDLSWGMKGRQRAGQADSRDGQSADAVSYSGHKTELVIRQVV